MKTYTYNDSEVAALYRQTRGYAPGVFWMRAWNLSSPSRKQLIWDSLLVPADW